MKKLINEIITDLRKRHKLSRKGIENISGFKERTVGSYERGERDVSKEYVEFISLYFGVPEAYIRGESTTIKLDKTLQIILMYQSIYNHSDENMAHLLATTTIKYQEFKRKNYLGELREALNLLSIAEELKIKPSFLGVDLTNTLLSLSLKTKEEQTHINKIENLNERFNFAEKIGTTITPEYYASIIKKRNQPETTYTPISNLNEIPEKFREILELLPYAPDSFIDTLTEKLRTMRDAQKL